MSNADFPDVTRRRFLTFTGSALAGAVLTTAAPAPVIAQGGASSPRPWFHDGGDYRQHHVACLRRAFYTE